MKLNVKAVAFASAVLWGVLAMFLTGMANLIWPTYGQNFLQLMASVYPGYNAAPSLLQVMVGALYGIADGAIGGALFAWLYNWCVATQTKQTL
jgi:hypothetical protein